MTWGDAWIEAAGKRLEVRSWGAAPDDGRAIVLLHEGLGCAALWRDFPAALNAASGLPVLAYSRAGYGMSDADDLPRPLDWMTREASVLAEVLDVCGISQPHLVGHSDGATIAAIAAGGPLLGRDLGPMVLIAPHFFTEDIGITEIARIASKFDASGYATRMGQFHRDPVATFRGWADAWLDPAFRSWDVTSYLETITAPVLVIQGRDDQYGTLAQVNAVTDRAPHGKALILDRCRHAPHLENSKDVVAGICNFLHDNA